MKKLLALALVLVMAMSVFVGCATGSSAPNETEVTTEPVSTTARAVTPVTESTTNSVAETKPAEQEAINGWFKNEIQENTDWIDTGKHTGIDVTTESYLFGYPELIFKSDAISDLNMYIKDDKMVITYTAFGVEHEIHAAKGNEITNISGIDISNPIDVTKRMKDNGVHFESYSWNNGEQIYLHYAELTGNIYSEYVSRMPSDIVNVFSDAFNPEHPYFPDGFWASPGSGLFYPNVTPIISEMKVYFGDDEVKTYPYRTGTTFGDWATSELNTDGWHINQSGWVMSPDGKWSAYEDTPIIGSVHLDQKTYGYNNVQYDENILYCFNSNTRLYVAGIQVVSTSFPEDNFGGRGIFRVANHLGTNDDIKFIFDVYYEELIPDMKVYFAPHSDSTTELPENTTEYSVYKETVTREFVLNEPVDVIAAVMNYKPAEDPNFVADSMDMFITYQGEVIYKIALPRFE